MDTKLAVIACLELAVECEKLQRENVALKNMIETRDAPSPREVALGQNLSEAKSRLLVRERALLRRQKIISKIAAIVGASAILPVLPDGQDEVIEELPLVTAIAAIVKTASDREALIAKISELLS